MDTELLKTFLEVRSTRHFGRAAENLYLTQAAVSARIKQLEANLGVSLFIRNRNNIQLSSEGERLVPHAEAVLLSLARARQEVTLPDLAGSQVYLGVRTGIWGGALQDCLHALREGRPELSIRLDRLEPDSLVRRLLDRTLDMAILYEPPSVPELKCLRIGALDLALFSTVPEQSMEQALAENYVYLDWGGGFSRFHNRRFADQGVPSLHSNMNELASDYLLARGGACYLPASQSDRLARDGIRAVHNAPHFKRELNIAYHSSSSKRALLEQLLEFFKGVKV